MAGEQAQQWDNQRQGGMQRAAAPAPAAPSTDAIAPLPGAAHPQWYQASPRDSDLPASTSLPHALPISLYPKRNHGATRQAPQLGKAVGWGEEATRLPAPGCQGAAVFLMPLISIPPSSLPTA